MELIGWIFFGVAAAVLLAAFAVYFNNNCLTVTRYTIQNEKADRELKIVHLSDLHGKRFGRENASLIKKAAKQSPDFFAITGDIIHRYSPKNIAAALELVSALKEIAPVLFVAGNHEMRNKGYRFFRKQLLESGVTVLDDRAVELCGITVTGVNDLSLRKGKIPSPPETEGLNILLAHEPQFRDLYEKSGYDVVLCGHAHGGQWRIPFTKQGLFAPSQGLFPKYTSGVHVFGKTSAVISRGLGNSRFPLRLFNRPEIVVLTVTK